MQRGDRQAEAVLLGWSGETPPKWMEKAYELAEGRHLTPTDDVGEAAVVVLSAPMRERMFAP